MDVYCRTCTNLSGLHIGVSILSNRGDFDSVVGMPTSEMRLADCTSAHPCSIPVNIKISRSYSFSADKVNLKDSLHRAIAVLWTSAAATGFVL